MDLVPSCRDKLTYFRIKELKDVLTQLGLGKQGKKQDLVDRILALLSDEQVPRSQGWGKKNSIGKETVAKIIDDTCRKMQVHGATDLASKSHSGSDFNHVKPKEEMDVSYQLDMRVRCLCGSSLITESMIKCEDPRCQVWQHIGCVIIPEKPMEGVSPELPPHFYCELCRINRADPFWVTIRHPLLPVKLTSSGITAEATNTVQNVERTFQLSRRDREMLQRSEYDLQVWCVLLNDKVPFRMQWPQYADLQVNGVQVRVVGRPGSQTLGINGRDDGPVITIRSREGINKICLSRCDSRIFCFGIRIGKRQTIQQVLNLVLKEADGEHLEDALARVRRCIGGGNTTEDADSDSDLEVVADSVTVNLRCPMSGSRIKIAGRFKPCVHMGCFDLDTFVELSQRSRKWQCPICLKNYSLENIIVDPYFSCITSLLQNCGEDVDEIDVKPDGCWRAKIEGEFGDLGRWHMPDGTLCAKTDTEVKPDLENLRRVKQDGTLEGHTGLRLGIERNCIGIWEVNNLEDMKPPSFGNHVLGTLDNHCQNIIPMSSSPTGSYRDGEDPSVNQEGEGNFDLFLNNNHELDSRSLNFDPTYNVEDRIPLAPSKDPDIIVLTDSDEDNRKLIFPENAYETGPSGGSDMHFTAIHPGVSERYPEYPGLGTSGTSCLGQFNNNGDDFGMPLWPMQTCLQTGPGFQLFGTDAEVPDGLVGSHNSLGCATSNGYGLASDGGLGDGSCVQDLSNFRSTTDMNGSLVDNLPSFSSNNTSLQNFFPSQPADVTMQPDLRDTEMLNGVHSDAWISLTLAAGGGLGEYTANGLSPGQHLAPKGSRTEPLEDAGKAIWILECHLDKVDFALGQPWSSVPRF
ncbi:E3 SUMO-protein ligase SIZ1-like isoform X2 [Phoenix dactylifera]|uniref:E3 SUMO-protein ligase SIZ1 n=1 Tax=Phoenix dactylifera TaxID=42345 RepID=A0A8B9AAH5_PHODC|nr:E3 SUMO-protein ligase SIZ1-like isoform X2 [Phoenix dactylifera]